LHIYLYILSEDVQMCHGILDSFHPLSFADTIRSV